MKFFLIVLVLNAVWCYAMPTCQETNLNHFVISHLGCTHKNIAVQGLARKIVNGHMTYESLKQNIASLCEEAKPATCYQEITQPIPGACNATEAMQHFRNSMKVILTYNEYLCQNNGNKYLELVENGGAECYLNKEKAKCFAQMNESGNENFAGSSACLHVESDIACTHHYDNCENHNVKLFSSEILQLMKANLSC